jgi:hypothetical protein
MAELTLAKRWALALAEVHPSRPAPVEDSPIAANDD